MVKVDQSSSIAPAQTEPATRLPPGHPLVGRRILVVHDSPEIAAVLLDVFAAAGAQVAVAHEGTEANVFIAWGGHDLVFLDAAVPGAADVLSLLAEHRPNLLARTIVLTSDVRDGRSVAGLRVSYPSAFFCDSWLVDLVGVASRVIAASERRAVA
jgi:CheY-like chemotaxis protein